VGGVFELELETGDQILDELGLLVECKDDFGVLLEEIGGNEFEGVYVLVGDFALVVLQLVWEGAAGTDGRFPRTCGAQSVARVACLC